MNRTITIATALVILSIIATVTPYNIRPAHAAPYVDPALAKIASASSPSATTQIIIVLNHTPTSADSNAIQQYSTMTAPMSNLPMILATTTFANLANIEAYSGVVSVWENAQLSFFGQVSTTTHSYGEVPVQHSWWDTIMRVQDAWALGYQGQGVTVALVDTGIDASNPSLGYNFASAGLSQAPYRVIQNVKVADVGELASNQPLGPDQIYAENVINTDTTSGHGTSTAGMVANTGDASNGVYKGTAPQANILGLGTGDGDFVFYAVASFNYIIANQAKYNIRAVSNSWGTDFHCSLLYVAPFDIMPNPPACRDGSPIWIATKAVHDAGVAVFFAAGNDGPGNPTINPYAEPSWVIGVGAGTESHGLADFSSRGCANTGDPACTNVSEQQPDLVTPGINVISTKAKTGATDNTLSSASDTGNIPLAYQPYYTTFGGTSAASPTAEGVAALVLSANPSLTPDQLKTVLKSSTDPMLGSLPFQVGTGYVNALNAVKLALGKGFQTGNNKAQAFGDQRFTYQAYIGGEVAVTDNWMDGNFPVYSGATSVSFTASWSTPSTDLQWQVNVYGPNDNEVTSCFSPLPDLLFVQPSCPIADGTTSVSYTVTNSSYIASLDNPGFTSGTWTIQVINFNNPQTITLTVDVNYPAKASTHMKNAHDIQVTDSQTGGLSGQENALLESYTGTVLSTITLAPSGASVVSADVTQSTNTVISAVQIVTVDSNGNVLEVRGGWVTTQSDLNTRAAQIQQQLLTTIDPTQVTALKTELSAVQAALPTAPLTATL